MDYAGLKQAVIDHLERDDLTDQVDTFIDLAESRHKREIRIREMLSRSTLAIAEDDIYLDLPSDFLDLKYLRIQNPDAAGRTFLPDLRQVSIHEITNERVQTNRYPRHFAVHTQIELSAPSDQAYTAEIFYYQELTALSDSNTSNELLAKAEDVYLYSALSASAPFLMHDERISIWEALYTQARDGLNTSEQDNRRGGPLVSRVANANNPRY